MSKPAVKVDFFDLLKAKPPVVCLAPFEIDIPEGWSYCNLNDFIENHEVYFARKITDSAEIVEKAAVRPPAGLYWPHLDIHSDWVVVRYNAGSDVATHLVSKYKSRGYKIFVFDEVGKIKKVILPDSFKLSIKLEQE